MPRPQPLWQSLDAVAARLRPGRRLFVATDFDGTLAELRAHPRRVGMGARTRAALERLAPEPGVRVAVLSGRSLVDLRRQVRTRGVYLSGLAGLETLEPGGKMVLHAPAGTAPPVALREGLAAWCLRFPGAWVEDKGAVLAVHYRGVPPERWKSLRAGVVRRVGPYARRTRLLAGRAVLELLPRLRRDKAAALRDWLDPVRPELLVSVGDDANDEPLHAFVRRRRGISVAVDRTKTCAEFGLESSAEVPRFLEWLREAWRGRKKSVR